MPERRRLLRSLAMLSLATLAACHHAGGSPALRVGLFSPRAFQRDFLLQQRVTIERGDGRQTVRTVLQRRGDSLVLLGLTPFGTRAFVVEQQGETVSARSFLSDDGALPFPPRAVLSEIQLALLPLLDAAPPRDGVRRGRVRGESVTERWRGGRLIERRLGPRRGASGSRLLVIRYGDGGWLPGDLPGHIEIEDGPLGLHLTVETVAWQWLEER